MTNHLYQRTITKNGKKIKCWYYWYYDSNGKQVRKSCGTNGKPCLLKREAESFIENLNIEEKKQAEKITFNEFCKGFYDSNSHFIINQIQHGVELKENTIYAKNLYLSRFLEKYGTYPVDSVSGLEFENWLLELDYSASVKNHIQVIFEEVEKELYINKLITTLPLIERYKRKNKKEKGVLSAAELECLFPDDYDDLLKVWTVKGCWDKDEISIYTFATMIYTIVSTGMRSSEIRALQWNQFVQPDAILINAMIDSNEERINQLKKGTAENKKWRVVVLPKKTQTMLEKLHTMQPAEQEFVFLRKGEPFTTWYLLDHLKQVLRYNDIDVDNRNLTVHSLRFTYNTIMRSEISGDDLRTMIGHVSEQMTDYYDRSKAMDKLPELLKNKETLDAIWK